MLNFRHVFNESVAQAYNELVNNKLRTFLSLLGIMIGIFCIIAVQSAVDSLESNIRGSFEKLGNDIIYVDKSPWEDQGNDYWKYMRRPRPSFEDYRAIEEKSKLTDMVSFSAFVGDKTIKFEKNVVEGVFVIGVTANYANIFRMDLSDGRFFNTNEAFNGANTVVIGTDVAENLFGSANPIGRTVTLGGKKLQVIGVIAKAGKSLINPLNFDQACLVPYKTAQFYINLRGSRFFSQVNAKAKTDVSIGEYKDEITNVLRAERRLKPSEESNFSLNEMSMLDKIFDSVFGALQLAGIIIGGFAILVGIFSVANIMFVSVKERTNLIGIKMAVGAQRGMIMMEFLIESVILCLIGGIMGLILVFGVLYILSSFSDFKMTMSIGNITTGIVLSVLVGILSGVIPAYNASRLNPVEAIRQG